MTRSCWTPRSPRMAWTVTPRVCTTQRGPTVGGPRAQRYSAPLLQPPPPTSPQQILYILYCVIIPPLNCFHSSADEEITSAVIIDLQYSYFISLSSVMIKNNLVTFSFVEILFRTKKIFVNHIFTVTTFGPE